MNQKLRDNLAYPEVGTTLALRVGQVDESGGNEFRGS